MRFGLNVGPFVLMGEGRPRHRRARKHTPGLNKALTLMVSMIMFVWMVYLMVTSTTAVFFVALVVAVPFGLIIFSILFPNGHTIES